MAMNFATDIVIANSYTLSHGRKENTTVGPSSFAFGTSVTASAYYSHAEGYITTASGQAAHAEGQNSIASGQAAHVEGISTTASGMCAHAEGISSIAASGNSHAEGLNTKAMGNNQHTSGKYNVPHGRGTYIPWLGGTSYYVGDKVVRNSTYYICTEDNNDSEFNSSKWESISSSNVDKYAEIIGNGTSDNARSNARALDWDGNEYLAGNLFVGCDENSENGTPVGRVINIKSNDAWFDVWTKLDSLEAGESVTFNTDSTTASSTLTGDVYSGSAIFGIVKKSTSTAGSFFYIFRGASNLLYSGTTTGANSSSAGTFEYTTSAKTLTLTSTDTTWAKIWAKLNTLANYEVVNIYIHANAYAVLNSGADTGTPVGIVYRTDSGTFHFLIKFAGLGLSGMKITGASSSSAGTFTQSYTGATSSLDTNAKTSIVAGVNELVSVKARQNQFLAISTAISIPAAGSSKTYTVTDMTSYHYLLRWNFSSNSENNPPTSLQWTTGTGTFTIKNTGSVSPSQTVKPVFFFPNNRTATAQS